ncbi:hypothetical protein PENTCL1PPCAC_4764, partial [Pristionchus entomophagus]
MDSIEIGSTSEINSVRLAMKGFIINKLSFMGVAHLHEYAEELSKLIVAVQTQRLVFAVNYANDMRNSDFFTAAAQHVAVIEIVPSPKLK